MNYNLNSVVITKKKHACGTDRFQVYRMGIDIKIKCLSCGREIMMLKKDIDKMVKRVEV